VAEGLIASTVLAMAVVGIAGPLGAAAEQARVVRERATALVLARELMEEVAAKPLLDGGTTCRQTPEAGETDRSAYDSADDYHHYQDTTSDMKDLAGRGPGFPPDYVYKRKVTVEYRTSPAGSPTTAGDFGVVTVKVTTPGGQAVKVTRLLCRQTLSF
jgi:hypothetical protein